MFREATETAIVVSVLLSFLNATFAYDLKLKRSLSRRVWLGTGLGILASLCLGAAFLVLLYKYANNLWASAELIWEATFSLVACILLTIMSLAFLRYDTLAAKWTAKLSKAIKAREEGTGGATKEGEFVTADGGVETSVVERVDTPVAVVAAEKKSIFGRWGKRNVEIVKRDDDSDDERTLAETEKKVVGLGAMIVIPFITVLREGLEGIVFLAGIAVTEDPGTIPIPAIVGLACGMIIGFILYRSGNTLKLHIFFISASVLLLILASGLLSKAVMALETYSWAIKVNALEDPDALDSYDLTRALWKLECCKASTPGGWSLLNAVTGWDAHATVASVAAYIGYWVVLAVGLVVYKVFVLRL
ncbi:iron permease FTR1/Fip1/EfeU [Chytridium lagenaria]|nr:iron permease FTR1/Fip1/EfeU [Chytridium lagenaria]